MFAHVFVVILFYFLMTFMNLLLQLLLLSIIIIIGAYSCEFVDELINLSFLFTTTRSLSTFNTFLMMVRRKYKTLRAPK